MLASGKSGGAGVGEGVTVGGVYGNVSWEQDVSAGASNAPPESYAKDRQRQDIGAVGTWTSGHLGNPPALPGVPAATTTTPPFPPPAGDTGTTAPPAAQQTVTRSFHLGSLRQRPQEIHNQCLNK